MENLNTLKEVIRNAKKKAMMENYNQVVIQDTDGEFSFDREYNGCCPDWYGKIIKCIVTYWENGILKCKVVEV